MCGGGAVQGRDVGFDSINAFELKISSGGGEAAISRDIYRICSRMDFFRLLHFYHSGERAFVAGWPAAVVLCALCPRRVVLRGGCR